jgi:hypothetical protein
MAGLKINFHKSEIITINDEGNWAEVYAEIFNCQVGTFPIKYLGVPVSPSRLHICDWLPLVEKSAKRLDVWQGGTMSIAGRSTLINSSLNNTPIYHMSIYLLPKTIIEKLDKIRRRFFWLGGGTKKKCHLIRWTKIRKHKKKGGLGIKDIGKMNISLLCKWWWKLENENGLWQQIINFKYLSGKSICTVKHRQNDFAMWFDLLKIKDIYLQGRQVKIGASKNTLFWRDSWLYDKPLYLTFPDLFKLCEQPDATVYQAKFNLNGLTFTRWLIDDLRNNWGQIMRDVDVVQLDDRKDEVIWRFGFSGYFSVKSTYKAMTVNDAEPYHKMIWKGKIPSKIKIFLWLIMNKAILTKDNMIKRKWPESPTCYFCSVDENAQHLLFQCSTSKAVWAIVAHLIGATNIPKSLDQCWS